MPEMPGGMPEMPGGGDLPEMPDMGGGMPDFPTGMPDIPDLGGGGEDDCGCEPALPFMPCLPDILNPFAPDPGCQNPTMPPFLDLAPPGFKTITLPRY